MLRPIEGVAACGPLVTHAAQLRLSGFFRGSAGGAPFTVFAVRKCGSTFKSEQTPEHILRLIVAFYHVQDTFDRPARSPGFSLLECLGARAHLELFEQRPYIGAAMTARLTHK